MNRDRFVGKATPRSGARPFVAPPPRQLQAPGAGWRDAAGAEQLANASLSERDSLRQNRAFVVAVDEGAGEMVEYLRVDHQDRQDFADEGERGTSGGCG
ncbi:MULTISPECIES: hypothetical protein [unclassified Micromonospora]|uniref:hypothetical protein n=1 Tax=unclassified Micromonospora TaxID=2617518 RepID=UPI002490D758|nr:hypothetical protein [Micromonospora sp. AKA38]